MADNLGQLFFELGVHDNVSKTLDAIQKSIKDTQKAAVASGNTSLDKSTKLLKTVATNADALKKAAADVEQKFLDVGNAIAKMKVLGKQTDEMERFRDSIRQAGETLKSIAAQANGLTLSTTGFMKNAIGSDFMTQLRIKDKEMRQVDKDYSKYQTAMLKAAERSEREEARAAERAVSNYQKLDDILLRVSETRARLYNASLTASQQEKAAIDELLRQWSNFAQALHAAKAEYERMKQMGQVSASTLGQKGGMGILLGPGQGYLGYEHLRKASNETARTVESNSKRMAASIKEAEQPVRDLAREFRHLQDAASQSSRVISDLKSMLYQYGSIYGIQQMAMSIITVGGELEKQHIALQSIIGDVTKANVLFEQTKELALQSPFTFSELNKDVKQLAAYGVEYDDLYDTTKRLADISSGLGVSFERIALAFGQTKARSWLDGKELRQFAYAGIPLMQKLSDLYSQLEGRKVTNSEVKKRISARQVSFEDVRKILWDMTDESGQFYNMQMVLSETLLGRYNKLKDAWEIMLADFARGESVVGGSLKFILDRVTDLVLAMHTLSPIIASVFAVPAMRGLAAMFTGGGKIAKNLLAAKQGIAGSAQSKLLSGQQLTPYEQRVLATKEKITAADLRQLAAAKAINQQELNRLYLSNQITKAQYRQLAAMAGLQMQGNKVQVGLRAIGGSIAGMARGLWNFVGGWAGVAMAGVGALIALWSKHNDAVERARAIHNDAINDAKRGLQEVSSLEKELLAPEAKNLTGEQMEAGIGRMVEFLKEYDPLADEVMRKAFGKDAEGRLLSVAERYKYLYEQMKNVKDMEEQMSSGNAPSLGKALEEVNGRNWLKGMFTRNVQTEAKDAQKEYDDFQRAVTNYYKNFKNSIEQAVDAARAQDENFARDTNGMESYAKMLEILVLSQEKYATAAKAFQDTNRMGGIFSNLTNGSDSRNRLNEEYGEMAEKLREMTQAWLDQALTMGGVWSQFDKWGEEQLRHVTKMINDFLNSEEIAGLSDFMKQNIANIIAKYVNDKTSLSIDFKVNKGETVAEVNAIEEEVKALIGKDYALNLRTATNAFEMIKQVREQVDDAKKKIENAKPIMLKFGLSMDLSSLQKYAATVNSLPLPDNVKSFMKTLLDDLVKNTMVKEQGEKVAKHYGFSLTDPTKGKKKGNKSGRTEDKELKERREQLKRLRDFYTEYKKYTKENMSSEAAIARLEGMSIYSSLRGRGQGIITDYPKALQSLLFGGNPSTERKSFNDEIRKLVADFDFDNNLAGVMEKNVNAMKEYISKMDELWDAYRDILEKTGDKDFASAVFSQPVVWDEVTRDLLKRFNDIGKERGVIPIAFDWGEATEASLKESLVNDKGEIQSDLVDLALDIQAKIRKNGLESLRKSADAIAATRTYQQELNALVEKRARLEEQIAKNTNDANNPAIIEGLKAQLKGVNNEILKLFEKSPEYLRFYESILSLTIPEAEKIGRRIRENLDDKLRNGVITAKQYTQEVKRIGEQLKKLREYQSGFGAFMSGGLEGLFKGMYDKSESDYNQASQDFKDASEIFDEAVKSGDHATATQAGLSMNAANNMKEGAAAAMEGAQGAMGTVAVIDKIVHGINNMVQGIHNAVNEIREMSESLGFDTESDAWENFGGFWDTFSKASQHATDAWDSLKSGNAGGVISGVVGSITSWVTGIAQIHDKKLDNAIKRSQREVKRLEIAYNNLYNAIENTLGSFYVAGGYNVLLESMKSQRDEISRQLELEKDKKNTDSDKILDYESQLNDLNSKISNFAMDIADSFYGIDIKSWAQDLTDAVVDAWANGEDAAQAWHDKVDELVKDVGKKILAQKYVEMMLTPVMDEIINSMTANDGALDEQALIRAAQKLNDAEGKTVDNLTRALEILKANGIDLGSDGSSSDKNVIRGEFTEQETGLLLSYVNAIRADDSIMRMDVSAIRLMLEQMPVAAQAQLRQLEFIAENTRRTAENTAMIVDIHSLLRNAQQSRDYGLYMK